MKNNPTARKERNEKLKAEIIKLYKEGYSYRELSKLLNISHEWARNLHLSTPVVDSSLTDIDSKNTI